MNIKERAILKRVYDSPYGSFSPAQISSLADGDQKSIEGLVAQGYLMKTTEYRSAGPINFYALTERGLIIFSSFFKRVWYKIKNNITLIVAIVSIFFGAFSSLSSVYVIKSYLDNKQQTNLRPELSFQAYLQEQKSFDDPNNVIPPYFRIKNNGAVSAIQMRVDFIGHEYDKDTGEILFSTRSDNQGEAFNLGELIPQETQTEEIAGEHLFRFIEEKTTDIVVEALISYRRDSDKKRFIYKVFYFRNSSGAWVNDRDPSLVNPIYDSVTTNLEKSEDTISRSLSDQLHEFVE